MVDQYNENQYDDDLTVGAGEYEEYDYTAAVDLFEFSNQEESQISRLKSLILSIDWEITDEVLMQFNEELVYLEGIWSDEKINLIYVQALQKISKYIYQQKVNSHPNAIKLLLIFYYNLEKITSSEELTSEQKKEIVLEDIKRFEGLKIQIARQAKDSLVHGGEDEGQGFVDPQVNENELLNLKATVLGIDWEITEDDLEDLRQEVIRLEEKYAESRTRLILLQGIGTLGAYIKVHQSSAHGDSFKLLHLFFESLEKIVKTPMSLDEEKAILFPVIEKFNYFKTLIGQTLSTDAMRQKEEKERVAASTFDTAEIQPALSDFQVDSGRGFQEEEEAKGLGDTGLIDVSSHIDQFFGGSPEDTVYQETYEQTGLSPVDEESEIPGVDVDLADELPASIHDVDFDDADGDAADELLASVDAIDFDDVDAADELPASVDALDFDDVDAADELPASVDDIDFDDVAGSSEHVLSVDKEIALQGVDVETEADDDSDEDALPVEDSGVLAPALGGSDRTSIYSADSLFDPSTEGSEDKKIIETVDELFVDEDPGIESPVEPEYDFEIQQDAPFVEVTEEEKIIDEDDVVDDVSAEIGANLDALFGDEGQPGVESAAEPEDDFDAREDVPAVDVVDEQRIAAKGGVFDDVSAEVNANLDAFFGIEQGVEEFEDASKVSGIDTGVEIVDVVEEEEVVFELVTSFAEEESDAAGQKLSDDIDKIPLDVSSDPIVAIGQYIDSISLEFDENSIRGIGSEISQLQQHWAAKNLEMSFLQLLSTVTQHVDRYRFESDPGAYELLKSNYDALAELEGGTLEKNQEVLFGEISKVLKWQQDLLFKQIGPK